MSTTTTQLLPSGEFCKLRYNTIPVKSASTNVTFYTNNSKMPNFELWHLSQMRELWLSQTQFAGRIFLVHWHWQFYDLRKVSSRISPIESVFNYTLNRSRHLRSWLFARRSVFLLLRSDGRLLLAHQYQQCQNLQSGRQLWESPNTGPNLANKVHGPISLPILCPKISAQLARHVQGYGTHRAGIWHTLCRDLAHTAGIWHTLCSDMSHTVQGYSTHCAGIWHTLCRDMSHTVQGYDKHCAGIWHTLCRDMLHTVQGYGTNCAGIWHTLCRDMLHTVQGYGTHCAGICHTLCRDMSHTVQGYGTHCAGIWHTLCRDMTHTVQGYDTHCARSVCWRRWSCSLEKAWTLARCLEPAHDALNDRELGA